MNFLFYCKNQLFQTFSIAQFFKSDLENLAQAVAAVHRCIGLVQVQCDALPTRQVQSFSPLQVRVDEKADAA